MRHPWLSRRRRTVHRQRSPCARRASGSAPTIPRRPRTSTDAWATPTRRPAAAPASTCPRPDRPPAAPAIPAPVRRPAPGPSRPCPRATGRRPRCQSDPAPPPAALLAKCRVRPLPAARPASSRPRRRCTAPSTADAPRRSRHRRRDDEAWPRNVSLGSRASNSSAGRTVRPPKCRYRRGGLGFHRRPRRNGEFVAFAVHNHLRAWLKGAA